MKEVSFDGNDLENMVLSLRLVMLITNYVKLIYYLDAQNKTWRYSVLTDIFKKMVHSLNILELELFW